MGPLWLYIVWFALGVAMAAVKALLQHRTARTLATRKENPQP